MDHRHAVLYCSRETSARGRRKEKKKAHLESDLWIEAVGSVAPYEVDTEEETHLDDVVLSQVRRDRGQTLPDHVRLVRLVAVSAETVLVRVDGDRLETELVSGTEDANGDFLRDAKGEEKSSREEKISFDLRNKEML